MEINDSNNGDKHNSTWLVVLMIVVGIVCGIILIVKLILPWVDSMFNHDSIKEKDQAVWNTIYSNARQKVMMYDEMVAVDKNLEEDKKLGDIPEKIIMEWQCLGRVIVNSDDSPNKGKSLFELLDLKKDEFVSLGKVIHDDKPGDASYCSAIRKDDKGMVQILLVASYDSPYVVSSKGVVYAFSDDSLGNVNNKK